MSNLKRLVILAVVLLAASAMVMGQGGDLTVEQSFLQESLEMMIIREQSRSESREMKWLALEYIGDAIRRGNSGEEIHSALVHLSMEGVRNQVREGGRLVNNHPDIRRQSAIYLGQLGTREASEALIQMLRDENEPMVIQEAIRSLGIIGINENGEAVDQIIWVLARYDNLNPDNLMALSAIVAFERIASLNDGFIDNAAIRTLMRIAEGPYTRDVRERARTAIATLREGMLR